MVSICTVRLPLLLPSGHEGMYALSCVFTTRDRSWFAPYTPTSRSQASRVMWNADGMLVQRLKPISWVFRSSEWGTIDALGKLQYEGNGAFRCARMQPR